LAVIGDAFLEFGRHRLVVGVDPNHRPETLRVFLDELQNGPQTLELADLVDSILVTEGYSAQSQSEQSETDQVLFIGFHQEILRSL
jgi:hypothetical protein